MSNFSERLEKTECDVLYSEARRATAVTPPFSDIPLAVTSGSFRYSYGCDTGDHRCIKRLTLRNQLFIKINLF